MLNAGDGHTKAEMLITLKENIKGIHILPILVIHSQEYFADVRGTVDSILEFSKGMPLIIRSSSRMEDTDKYSNAGKYESVLNVMPRHESIQLAIDRVYGSYDTCDDEEILIQPMLSGIKMSGVVFTADADTFADYYIVNYCEGSDTSAVTSGSKEKVKTFIYYKKAPIQVEDAVMGKLIDQCKTIESFLHNNALDIEFAVGEDNLIYILQVRQIASGGGKRKRRLLISNLR